MIIHRWQGHKTLNLEEIKKCYHILEDQDFREEKYPATSLIKDHTHNLLEIRIICSGELLCNVAGNQILLRPGDKIEIPANTRHSYANNQKEDCISLVGYYSF